MATPSAAILCAVLALLLWAPVGWLVTGYPWYAISTPQHQAFLSAYQQRFADYPRLGSVVGYVTAKSLAVWFSKIRAFAAP